MTTSSREKKPPPPESSEDKKIAQPVDDQISLPGGMGERLMNFLAENQNLLQEGRDFVRDGKLNVIRQDVNSTEEKVKVDQLCFDSTDSLPRSVISSFLRT